MTDLSTSLIIALDQLEKAIVNRGPSPRFHEQTMSAHRREWPTLWRAIDELRREYHHLQEPVYELRTDDE